MKYLTNFVSRNMYKVTATCLRMGFSVQMALGLVMLIFILGNGTD